MKVTHSASPAGVRQPARQVRLVRGTAHRGNQPVDHNVPFASGGIECVASVARRRMTCNKFKGSLSLEDLFAS